MSQLDLGPAHRVGKVVRRQYLSDGRYCFGTDLVGRTFELLRRDRSSSSQLLFNAGFSSYTWQSLSSYSWQLFKALGSTFLRRKVFSGCVCVRHSHS